MRENYEVLVISKLHTLPQCEMPLEWIDLLAVSGQSVNRFLHWSSLFIRNESTPGVADILSTVL